MNHVFVLIHFIAFSTGIGLITLANFLVPKLEKRVLKLIIRGDLYYTMLLLFDTLDIYLRKNVPGHPELLRSFIYLGQFLAGIGGLYFLTVIVFDILKKQFKEKIKVLFWLAAGLCLLITSGLYLYHDSIRWGLKASHVASLFPFMVFSFNLICLWINRKQVDNSIKPLIYSSIAIILILSPLKMLTNMSDNLPLFIYKIPYTPLMYFLLNAVGIAFLKGYKAEGPDSQNDYERTKAEAADPYEVLCKKYGVTERELEIVRYIVSGYGNPEISSKLFISQNTVKNHVYNIYRKIGIKNRFELISLLSQVQNPQEKGMGVERH
ncbi:MAG: helix-turn-helix transcriptional regulator [Clostridia bacterium]|nr:helix-turn-helix transcriptional regulator [Clostridia bacterium]